MLPIIYIILNILRFVLTLAFRPLFILFRGDLSFAECAFVAGAGLRGSVSLIMGQALVTSRTIFESQAQDKKLLVSVTTMTIVHTVYMPVHLS